MLKKLIKYEWKSTSKIVLIMLLVVAGATLLGAAGIVLPLRYLAGMGMHSKDGDIMIVFMTMTAMMTFFLYVFSLVGVNYVLYGYQSVRFYKTMYTDEGYLTHTLPLTPGQILLGKTFVAVAWSVIMNLCVVLSVGVLIAISMVTFGDLFSYLGLQDLPRMVAEAKDELIRQGYLFQVVHLILSMVLTLVITPFGVLLMIFGSLSIGQLARKHRLLWGILTLVGMFFVNSIFSQILRFVFTIAAMASMDAETAFAMSYAGAMDSGVLTFLIMGSVMYLITYQILSKKLNLD